MQKPTGRFKMFTYISRVHLMPSEHVANRQNCPHRKPQPQNYWIYQKHRQHKFLPGLKLQLQ